MCDRLLDDIVECPAHYESMCVGDEWRTEFLRLVCIDGVRAWLDDVASAKDG